MTEPVKRRIRSWQLLLVLLVLFDVVLLLVFFWSMAVYNCHGGYECPI